MSCERVKINGRLPEGRRGHTFVTIEPYRVLMWGGISRRGRQSSGCVFEFTNSQVYCREVRFSGDKPSARDGYDCTHILSLSLYI